MSAGLVMPMRCKLGWVNGPGRAGWSVWPVRVHMPAGAGQQPRQLSSIAAVAACADHILPGRGAHQPQCGGRRWEQRLRHSRSVHPSPRILLPSRSGAMLVLSACVSAPAQSSKLILAADSFGYVASWL